MLYHAHKISVICALAVSLLFFGACTDSEESAAESVCDKLIECGEEDMEYREVCVHEIRILFAEAEIEEGEDCRSAVVSFADCLGTLTCAEFDSLDGCEEQEAHADVVCDDF